MKNNAWLPTATIETLKKRAQIIATIRQFFSVREVLEVETPLLAEAGVTDIHLENISARMTSGKHHQELFLQTSPEYFMKRLLAAGSGSIYQIGKAFRQDEIGKLHNPEFTMLEWYRVGFDHHHLMDEMDDLLQLVLQTKPANRISYQKLFQLFLDCDPLAMSPSDLQHVAEDQGVNFTGELDKDGWLSLLMTHCIEPWLGFFAPVFITDFPASQASLAKISSRDNRVAERFEVYVQGIELANGFHELTDSDAQRARFLDDNAKRRELGLSEKKMDELFLQALDHGLPKCAGVALGLDRLLMLALCKTVFREVVTFV